MSIYHATIREYILEYEFDFDIPIEAETYVEAERIVEELLLEWRNDGEWDEFTNRYSDGELEWELVQVYDVGEWRDRVYVSNHDYYPAKVTYQKVE